MTEEEILKLWNMGLSRMQTINIFMKTYNRKAKDSKETKRINKEQAMRIVEPILFRYETERMKN